MPPLRSFPDIGTIMALTRFRRQLAAHASLAAGPRRRYVDDYDDASVLLGRLMSPCAALYIISPPPFLVAHIYDKTFPLFLSFSYWPSADSLS